jgi:long-subunit acyl-CoA synthetase (AMP-forming)
MLQRSQCRSIIVDAQSLPQLDALLDGDNGKLLLAPDLEDPRYYRERWPQHIFLATEISRSTLPGASRHWMEDAIAYLLFKSGSTGAPKGVMVAHRNVTSFVAYIAV